MILISFMCFRIFQIFYNVCAFLLKSDVVHFLNIDASILICHVFTLTVKNIYTAKGLERVYQMLMWLPLAVRI